MSGTEIPTRRPHKRRKETISNDRLVTALNAALIESTICVPPIAVNVWQGLDSPTDKEVEGLTRKGRRASSDLFDDFMEPRPNALGVCDAISWALYTDTTFTHFIENGIRPPGCTASLSSPTWTFYAWLATLQRSLTPFELTEWYAETFGPLIEVMEDVLKKDTSSSGPDSDDAAEDAERPAKRQKTSSETKCTKVWQFLDEMRTLQMKTSVRNYCRFR
ncbi:hypothetical protein R3P38DRAFT_2922481 [Favolaschia claudopus]|uniref:Uncharacterized protein n=1 Tax=Favolaschia claudopus TaxID=2862362 RepID=A0AAW0C5N3_9AGAR